MTKRVSYLADKLVEELLGELTQYVGYAERDGQRKVIVQFHSLPAALMYQARYPQVRVVPVDEWHDLEGTSAAPTMLPSRFKKAASDELAGV